MAVGLEDIVALLSRGQITPGTAELMRARIPAVPQVNVGAFGNPMSLGTPAAAAPPPPPPVIPTSGLGTDDQQFRDGLAAIPTPPGSDDWMSRAAAGDVPTAGVRPSPTTPPVGTPIPGSALNNDSAVAAPASPAQASSDLIQQGFDEQRAAAANARLGMAQAQTGVIDETVKQAGLIEDARVQEEKFQKEKQQRLDDGQALYKQSLADLDAQKVDPNRIYANASTGDKIIAAIGIALGGIASGLSGRGNVALQVIKDAIDRDVDAQKVEVEKKARGVSAQGTLYNELVGRLQNEDAARHYMTSLLLERSKSTLDQYKTQITNAQQSAALGKLYGEIDVAAGEAQAKAQEALAKDPAEMAAIRKGVKTGTLDPSSLPKEDRERYVPGLGFATDKESKDKLVKAATSYDDSVRLIDEMIKARTQGEGGGKGAEIASAAFIQKQKQRAASLKLKFKDLYSLGNLSESDYQILDPMVPSDPTSFTRANIPLVGGFFDDPIVAQLQEMKKSLTTSYQGQLRTLVEPTPQAANVATDLKLTPR